MGTPSTWITGMTSRTELVRNASSAATHPGEDPEVERWGVQDPPGPPPEVGGGRLEQLAAQADEHGVVGAARLGGPLGGHVHRVAGALDPGQQPGRGRADEWVGRKGQQGDAQAAAALLLVAVGHLGDDDEGGGDQLVLGASGADEADHPVAALAGADRLADQLLEPRGQGDLEGGGRRGQPLEVGAEPERPAPVDPHGLKDRLAPQQGQVERGERLPAALVNARPGGEHAQDPGGGHDRQRRSRSSR